MPNLKTTNGTVLMIASALMWSTGGVLIKLLPWHPLVISSIRSMIAALVLYGVMRYSKTKINFNRLALLSGGFLGLSTSFFVVSNKMTTAANAIVIQSANPVFIMLIMMLIYKQKVRRFDVGVMALCMLGITLFFFDDLSPGNSVGNLLALSSAVCLAAAYVCAAKAPDQSSAMTGVLIGHLITSLIGFPFLFTNTPDPKPENILIMLLLGIFQLGIPYALFSMAIRRCPPLTCSIVGMIEPVASPVWVALAVGEIPGVLALFGGVLVIVTVLWWSIRNAKAQVSTEA